MPYSVYCRIGGYDQGEYAIGLSLADGESAAARVSAQAFQDIDANLFTSSPPDAKWLSERLFAILFDAFVPLLDEAIARGGREPDGMTRVLLQLGSEKSESYPWELTSAQRSHAFEIVRWLPDRPRLTTKPLTLPLRVLVADMAHATPAHQSFSLRPLLLDMLRSPERLTSAFQPIELHGASRNDLQGVLSKSLFDIVHLQVQPAWSMDWGDDNIGFGAAIAALGDGPGLSREMLGRLLARSQTRLLVLQMQKPDSEYSAASRLTELARDIVGGRGPAVLIVPFDDTPGSAKFLEDFYANIVHDQPLDLAVRNARQKWRQREPNQPLADRSILALGKDSENLLRLSPLAPPLAHRAESQRSKSSQLRFRLRRLPDLRASRSLNINDFLNDADRSVRDAMDRANNIANWTREFGGLIPLDDATQAASNADVSLQQAEIALDDAERRVTRVVNSHFVKDKMALTSRRTLVQGQTYSLRLQIGAPLSSSHVRDAKPIAERFLEQFFDDKGMLKLDVCIHSDDFMPLEGKSFGRRPLSLPRLGPTLPLEIALRAPVKSGSARLRACVYYQQNLLQSLLITAAITVEEEELDDGNFAEVEFSMSDTMLNIERLPPRSVNVLVNERKDGDHTFVIHGPDFEEQYSFPDSSAVATIRRDLQTICSKLDAEGNPVAYLFSDPDNNGNRDKLASDLLKLAPTGYALYFDLISDPANIALEERLHTLLAKPGTIQISVTVSDKTVYPWAFLYDKPFVGDPANQICPQILQRIAAKTAPEELRTKSCIDGGCPHTADTNVICPLGFWGFRHDIDTLPPKGGDAVTTIQVNGGLDFMMATHRELDGPAHRAEIEALAKITTDYRDAKKDIGTALTTTKPHLIYFFCHGGRTADRPWLGVGKKDQIEGTDFHAWKARWPETHPLVVINGCHTVDLSPDDILNFVKVFSWCQAAGVIGTEIAIPESLGREFGRYFVPRFRAGQSVATILRGLRLSLLAKWNVLGLCYTAYCHSDLRLETIPGRP